jgi:hypothetical protein
MPTGKRGSATCIFAPVPRTYKPYVVKLTRGLTPVLYSLPAAWKGELLGGFRKLVSSRQRQLVLEE